MFTSGNPQLGALYSLQFSLKPNFHNKRFCKNNILFSGIITMMKGGLGFVDDSNSGGDIDYTLLTVKMVPKYFKFNMHIQHSDLPIGRKSLFSIGNSLQIFSKDHKVYLKSEFNNGENTVEILIFKPRFYKFYDFKSGPSSGYWYKSIKSYGVVKEFDDTTYYATPFVLHKIIPSEKKSCEWEWGNCGMRKG